MPRRKSSVKRTRADAKKHLHNIRIKQTLKKSVKNYLGLVSEKKGEDAKKLLQQVCSLLDKAAKKRVIHPRTADRKKSRLMKRLAKAA